MIIWLRERNLLVDNIWQIPIDSVTSLDQFSSPVSLGNIFKTPRGNFDLSPHWLRASPSRWPIQCGQRSGCAEVNALVACQVSLRFCTDREIAHGPIESAGPRWFWSTSSSAVQTRAL